MNIHLLSLASMLLLVTTPSFADTFGSGANKFTIDFVRVGNPGNPADTTGNPNPAGSVPYDYRMGKYEISRDMITKANNEVALGITMDPMDFVIGGPHPDMPASGVTWFETARFVNWLNESQGHQRAYNFDGSGEFQLWTSAEAWQTGGENLFRHKDAYYFLPSVDEWYKAAFYDPQANKGAGRYWKFPTRSDSLGPDCSGFYGAVWSPYPNIDFPNLICAQPTSVTHAGSLSPYGTMAQAGNVEEWQETESDLINDSGLSFRRIRGGSWWMIYGLFDRYLSSSDLCVAPGLCTGETRGTDPTVEGRDIGFRVASIPEPSTGVFSVLGVLGLMQQRERSKGLTTDSLDSA